MIYRIMTIIVPCAPFQLLPNLSQIIRSSIALPKGVVGIFNIRWGGEPEIPEVSRSLQQTQPDIYIDRHFSSHQVISCRKYYNTWMNSKRWGLPIIQGPLPTILIHVEGEIWSIYFEGWKFGQSWLKFTLQNLPLATLVNVDFNIDWCWGG